MMTSFELFDNFFQAAVMLVCAIGSGILAWRRRKPEYVLLSFSYLCWMLGTLYYVLHLTITGVVPNIFYVSELSWIASYLFLLSLSILQGSVEGISRRPVWTFLPASLPLALSLTFAILNGSELIAIGFGSVTAALCAHSLFRIASHTKSKAPLVTLVAIALQGAVYIISAFTADYTRFNAYFAADILLTLTLASLLPVLYREVES